MFAAIFLVCSPHGIQFERERERERERDKLNKCLLRGKNY
jgi:hypothetical protein